MQALRRDVGRVDLDDFAPGKVEGVHTRVRRIELQCRYDIEAGLLKAKRHTSSAREQVNGNRSPF